MEQKAGISVKPGELFWKSSIGITKTDKRRQSFINLAMMKELNPEKTEEGEKEQKLRQEKYIEKYAQRPKIPGIGRA